MQTGTSDVPESVHTLQKFQHLNDGSGSDFCYRCGRAGLGHSNVISVAALAISKQFVVLRLKGRRPFAKTDSGET